MKTVATIMKALGIALLASFALAQSEASESSTITFHLVLDQQVPADQIFYLRYAIPRIPKPQETIQLCGGVQAPNADRVIAAEVCQSGNPYTVEVQVASDTPVAFQVFTLRAEDPQNTYALVVQNFEGEMPDSPEDFINYGDGTTHWIWVAGNLEQ